MFKVSTAMSTDEFAPIDEDARRRFEKQLLSGASIDVGDFLPPPDDRLFMSTLEELALIHLDHCWSTRADGADTLVESYVLRFPRLTLHALPRLLEEEVRLRRQYDEDSVPTIAEYERRFPGFEFPDTLHEMLSSTLPQLSSLGSEAIIDRYEVTAEHAAGGMGVVYRALDPRVGREVALKRIRNGAVHAEETRRRFVNEAQLAGRLEHPGIVPVYDIGHDDDGAPYYTMKLVEGETFDVIISDRASQHHPWRGVLSILASVARTIAFAHSHGVIHRDLKPANIIVGSFGETVVLDWGIAKDVHMAEEAKAGIEAGGGGTQAGSILGTPAYMAPEQAHDAASVDHRADVYALGAILYHVLTGRPPATQFPRPADASQRTASPRDRNSHAPRPLEAVCMRAMAADPDQRFQDAREFADELDRYMADEPLRSYRDPMFVSIGRWARKHRTRVVALASLLAVLMVGGIAAGFVHQSRIAEQQRRLATLSTAVDSNEETARSEIRNGRFANGADYFTKAWELCENEPHLIGRRRELGAAKESAERLVAFHQQADRAELLAWDESDADAKILLERALADLHVFQRYDWWRGLTPFELAPEVEDRLQVRVHRELMMLAALRIKGAIYRGLRDADVGAVLRKGVATSDGARAELEASLTPLNAAARFRPAVGIDFVRTLAEGQLGSLVKRTTSLVAMHRLLSVALDPLQLRNGNDRFFSGLSLMFYASMGGQSDPLIDLVGAALQLQPSRANDKSVAILARASADDPVNWFTAMALGLALELQDDHQRTLEVLNRAVALNPQNPRALFHRAGLLLSMARTEGASGASLLQRGLIDLEVAQRLAPGESDYQWRKAGAMIAAAAHDPSLVEAALSESLQALLLTPPSPSHLHVSVWRQRRDAELEVALANARWLQAKASQPSGGETRPMPDSPMSDLVLAWTHWRQGRADEAHRLAKELVEADDSYAEAWVLVGELRLADNKPRAAKNAFERALELDDAQYLARRGIAFVHEQQGKHADALAAFRELVRTSDNAWRMYEALEHSCLNAVEIGADGQAMADVEQMLHLRPSASCDSILKIAKAKHPTFHAQLVERLSRRSPTPLDVPPAPGSFAALLNGGFELPLSTHWESTPERPLPWWNENGFRSTATATASERRSGSRSLCIRSLSSNQTGRRGLMRQTIPVVAGETYQLSAWARTQQLEAGAVIVRIVTGGDVVDVITLPAGSSDWRQLQGQVVAKSASIELQIVAEAAGTCWLDDIQLKMKPKGQPAP